MSIRRPFFCAAAPLALLVAACSTPRADAVARHATPPGLHVGIAFDAAASATPLDGRLLLLISTDSSAEPRAQIIDGTATQ